MHVLTAIYFAQDDVSVGQSALADQLEDATK